MDKPTRERLAEQTASRTGKTKTYRQLVRGGDREPGIFMLADRGHWLLKRAVLEGGTMRTLITAFLATTAILGSNGALAKPTLTFARGVPVGNRLEAIGEKMQEDHDGFTDVNPVFVLDDQKPGMLLLVFPATKAARDLGMKTAAEEAFIRVEHE
jgi:hypothetical protein